MKRKPSLCLYSRGGSANTHTLFPALRRGAKVRSCPHAARPRWVRTAGFPHFPYERITSCHQPLHCPKRTAMWPPISVAWLPRMHLQRLHVTVPAQETIPTPPPLMGNRWQMLIKAFAERLGGPPCVCITGMADPKVLTSLEGVRRRLEDVARHAVASLEFKPLEMEASYIEPWMLDSREGEVLAMKFASHLHRMPDESLSSSNLRDSPLCRVKKMWPKISTILH